MIQENKNSSSLILKEEQYLPSKKMLVVWFKDVVKIFIFFFFLGRTFLFRRTIWLDNSWVLNSYIMYLSCVLVSIQEKQVLFSLLPLNVLLHAADMLTLNEKRKRLRLSCTIIVDTYGLYRLSPHCFLW